MGSGVCVRRVMAVAAGACVALMSAASMAAAGDAYTVRIEPRPYYGATVTIEEGVRVYRPLPPTRRMIINPDGATPLNLSLSEETKTVKSRSTNYNHNTIVDRSGGGGYGVVTGFRRSHGRGGRAPRAGRFD